MEKTISSVLKSMTGEERDALELLCLYAAGKIKTAAIEVLHAAKSIHDETDSDKQRVCYYLIGKAKDEHRVPAILILLTN